MSIESFYGDLSVPPAIEIEPILPDFIEHVQRALEGHGGWLEGQRAYSLLVPSSGLSGLPQWIVDMICISLMATVSY